MLNQLLSGFLWRSLSIFALLISIQYWTFKTFIQYTSCTLLLKLISHWNLRHSRARGYSLGCAKSPLFVHMLFPCHILIIIIIIWVVESTHIYYYACRALSQKGKQYFNPFVFGVSCFIDGRQRYRVGGSERETCLAFTFNVPS